MQTCKTYKHILRYGTNAEQKYIDKIKDTFDLLAVNGNMLAYTPGALAGFIMMHILKSKKSQGYFIDPITHAFQHDIDKISSYSQKKKKWVVKKSVMNLMNCYGEPILSKITSGNAVRPSDFNSNEVRKQFCNNVINFQLNTILQELEEKGFMKYIREASLPVEKLKPCFIIPPYFYLEPKPETNYKWLPINLDFIKIAKNLHKEYEVYAQLVVSQAILTQPEFRDEICEKYISQKPDAILLWIDKFVEQDATLGQLLGFVEIVKKFYDNGIRVFNLYGGFFSIILTGFKEELKFELDGVGHGLEYGESRGVVPVGGGIPTNKYYYFPLHHRLDYRDASALLNALGYFKLPPKDGAKEYYSNICHCPICMDVIENDINNFMKFENTEFYEFISRGVKQKRHYADQDTKAICVLHYQFNKAREFLVAEKRNLGELIKILESINMQYLKFTPYITQQISYLSTWIETLKKIGRV